MTTPHDPTRSHSPLDTVIATYLQAVESGKVPDRQELLDRNPSLADPLRAFFSDLDRIDRVAAPLLSATVNEGEGVNPESDVPQNVRYFGDYELLEEIARGGMGVVYKARQVSLNRIVALKMILRGNFATERDVIRFRTEAEAAANLDHPNIVPIYEIGEHEGQQYFSMKLIEGGSLSQLARADAKTEVQRLSEVARAVHYAHRRGILHRDIKPSNILVVAQGTPFVTDFGLAKRLQDTENSLTETGQVLGTPRYMAPEQAAGSKDLSIAADVYSLGVVMYERLTGQTPFTGDNVLTVLRQVRENEPPRLSSIVPGMDRDLETVVLKCLQKEPNRRYESAEKLTEDLEHWLKGEPIEARPVGQTERAWRWCRRNPTVASLTATVAALLVVVATVSTVSAINAKARADSESRARVRAEGAEQDAKLARDGIEQTFAQSLVRPLDPNGDLKNHETLSEPEHVALWELASLQGKPLGLRFLEEATLAPLTSRQLLSRSEPALVAAVGLDPQQRDRAAETLSSKLRDPKTPLAQRAGIALVALELEDKPGPAADLCHEIVEQALKTEPAGEPIDGLIAHLDNNSTSLNPNTGARILESALERKWSGGEISGLATALVTTTGRMAPAEAALISHRAAKVLARTLSQNVDDNQRGVLGNALDTVVTRMDAKAAAGILEAALNTEKVDTSTLVIFGEKLVTVAERLDPVEARHLRDVVARKFATALETEKKGDLTIQLSLAFARLAKRLKPGEDSEIWKTAARMFAAKFAVEKADGIRGNLAWGLGPLAEFLGKDEAARVCLPSADNLAEALKQVRVRDDMAWRSVLRGLGALSIRLAPEQAARTVRLLAATIQREPNSLEENFQSLLYALDSSDAARAARVLVAAIGQEKDPKIRWWLCGGLCLTAERMKEEEVGEVCGIVGKEMAETLTMQGEPNLTYFWDGFAIVTSHLNATLRKQVLRVLNEGFEKNPKLDSIERFKLMRGTLSPAEAVETLIAMLEKETDANIRWRLSYYVADPANHAEPAVADRAARVLAAGLKESLDTQSTYTLAEALKSVAGRMTPGEGSQVLAAALESQIGSESARKKYQLSSSSYTSSPVEDLAAVIQKLANGLSEIAGRLPREEAAKVCGKVARVLATALERDAEDAVIARLAKALATVADRMTPAEASEVCCNAVQVLLQIRSTKPSNYESRGKIDESFSPLFNHLDPKITTTLTHHLAALVLSEVGVRWSGSQGTDMMGNAQPLRDPSTLRSLLTDGKGLTETKFQAWRKGSPGIAVMANAEIGAIVSAVALASEPIPSRLSTQDLVDLLKMPTCLGEGRRVVLDHLGYIHGRRFVNHWDFVRFARENRLDVDLTTPPVRPDPKAIMERMIELLSEAKPAAK